MTRISRALTLSALIAASALLAGSAEAQGSAEDWKLSLGKEFPGAHGNIFQAPDGAGVCLEGFFGNGGNYVAMLLPLKQPVDAKALKFDVKTADLAGLVIRITDSTGQCHAQHVALKDTSDWQTVTLKSLHQGEGANSWGGAADGKWHGPAKSVAILVDKKDSKYPDSMKGLIQVDKLELK